MSTARSVMKVIRSEVEKAALSGVYVYSFTVAQLPSVYALLDKQNRRKSMRVTYNNDHNFVVRYVPSYNHTETVDSWNFAVGFSLCASASIVGMSHPGVSSIGKATYRIGERHLEADGGMRPSKSKYPTVVLEVGDHASLAQREFDAMLWLEHLQVQLVVLISFGPPAPPFPNLPTISIHLWKRPQQMQACMVWAADWTQQATPLYILLSDVFPGGQVPVEYGNTDRFFPDTAWLRQQILDSYSWLDL